MRKLPALRIISIAAAGSALWSTKDADATIRVSLPARFLESLPRQCPIVNPVASESSFFNSSHISPFGLPIFSFKAADPSPSSDKKEAAGESNGNPKHCSGCLGRDSFANAATRVGPAVVNISVVPGVYVSGGGRRMGSGTIIDKDGTILTCAHHVADFQGREVISRGRVDVTLQDGRTFQGTLLNADQHSDIAILKIKSDSPLPAAKLGSSSKLRPGDWVMALGCPLSLQNTVTSGIVSCVDRKSSDLGLGGVMREYLQTDCAINPGSSGGPLVNIDGEVVGVNIMKVLAADGLSFSVPIDSVTKIIQQFKKRGRVIRPWLGLKMIDLNEPVIEQLKARDVTFPSVTGGVLVAMVIPGSPADRSGFQPGDVVVEFDGKSVGTVEEVIATMGDRVGKALKAVVLRASDKVVTLTVIPEESNPNI